MAKNVNVMESLELENGGELQVYIAGKRVALTFTKSDLEACIWVSKEEAQEYADKINKALSESEE